MHIAIVLEFELGIDNIKFIRKNINRYQYQKNLSFSIRIQIRRHILNIQTQYGRILTPPFGVGVGVGGGWFDTWNHIRGSCMSV